MIFQCTQNLVPLNAGLCNRENFPPLFFAKFPKIRNILRWPCQRNIYYRFPFLFLNKIHSSRLPEILFVAKDYFTCNEWLSVRLKAAWNNLTSFEKNFRFKISNGRNTTQFLKSTSNRDTYEQKGTY